MSETIKILFVDDEQNVLNAIRRVFMEEEYVLLFAISAEEGLLVLQKEHVQVIVSDYRMPGMNGIDFLREVNNRWPETVRVVLSGYADIDALVAAVNDGQIYKFIPKPWNDDELKVAMANAAERYFLHKNNIELTEALSQRNAELVQANDRLNALLAKETEDLEFRSQVVTSYQNILDAIPAGIVGIDPYNVVAICNTSFAEMTGHSWCTPGQTLQKGTTPACIINLVEEVRREGKVQKRLELDGVRGSVSSGLMTSSAGQEGVILLFVRDNGP